MDTILIVDDDVELCGLLTDLLSLEGFAVEAVHGGKEGLDKALGGEYRLVILDVMLPDMNGFEVLRRLRSRSNVPVLMLSARGEHVDRIVGLEMGSDDYLPKPFNTRELSARIRAILRRAPGASAEAVKSGSLETIKIDKLVLDPLSRKAFYAGSEVPLTTVEFRLLELLMKEAGNVVSRERISEKVLERPFSPYDRSIDVHVSSLRKKIWKNSKRRNRIRSVRGTGYLYTLR